MIEFNKQYERDTALLLQAFFGQGLAGENYLGIGKGNPHQPIILHYYNGQNVEMWENRQGMQWFADRLLEKNMAGTDFLAGVVADQRRVLNEIRPYWKKESLNEAELAAYLVLVRRGVDNVIYYFFSGMDERTPEAVKELSVKIRGEDDFMANNDIYIRKNVVARGYPDQYADVVFPEEFIHLPPLGLLKERVQHTLLVGGKEVFITTLQVYAKEHPEFVFKDLVATVPQEKEVRGQIAYKGKVQGVVRIVRNRLQMQEVIEGEILVSPMTTPDFLPAMKRAAAFVTDEGGIVCHAAIVAREMRKPCVIGTKTATQVLKDGDLVEVDAERGVVTILKRA